MAAPSPPRLDTPLSSTRPRPRRRGAAAGGFTLIELIIVVAIIGILAVIAVPALRNAPRRAKEAVLREDLYAMRSCIDQYLADHGQYPASLEELVEKGYLRAIPVDPITKLAEWTMDYAEPDQEAELKPNDQTNPGLIDVHSKAPGVGLDGTAYSEW